MQQLRRPGPEGTMNCAYCTAPAVQEQSRRTSLGYRVFRCSACQRTFNERTGSPFNFLEFPTDLVLLVVIWRLRYKLSLRDLAEMFLVRGLPFTHEAVREWEARFAPLIADRLRAKRRGKAGPSWYLDETYLKVKGRWCYLYRAIDRDGNLVDVLLSERRDRRAAKRFLRRALETAGRRPERATTDGHDAYPRAIREELGSEVEHRCSLYLNSRTEQDHRGIKQRYYPMRGFGAFGSAACFCSAFEELRSYLRWRSRMGETMSLADQRQLHRARLEELMRMLMAA
jgi:putative transposase